MRNIANLTEAVRGDDMSNAVFPEMTGLTWDIKKTPEFYSLAKTSPTGVDIAVSLCSYPRWHFSLSYEILRDGYGTADLQKLLGFFLQRHGNADDWLYLDPNDHETNNQEFGIGTGSRGTFALCRNYCGIVEPIGATVPGTVKIFVNDIEITSGFSITNGIVTFESPPAATAKLTWSGQYYYRCRFTESSLEFTNFAFKLWEAKTVDFVSGKRIDA